MNIIETPTSLARYFTDFLTADEADELLQLCEDLDLEKNPKAIVFGKPAVMHRSIGFFSDESEGYCYSGQIAKSQTLPKFLKSLLKKVNKTFDTDFNGILVNRYEDGTDSIGAHSDDEKGLGKGSKVIGISLGAERTVRFRGKKTLLEHNGKKFLDHVLEHGSVFTMEGDFQKEFTHEIPKQTKISKMRISLTFRKHTK